MNDFLSPNIKFQTMYYDDTVVKVGIFIPPEFFQLEVFKDLTGNSFKVLMVVLSHMSSTTYSCYPTIEQISNCTGLSKPSIIACTKQLKCWITQTKRPNSIILNWRKM